MDYTEGSAIAVFIIIILAKVIYHFTVVLSMKINIPNLDKLV